MACSPCLGIKDNMNKLGAWTTYKHTIDMHFADARKTAIAAIDKYQSERKWQKYPEQKPDKAISSVWYWCRFNHGLFKFFKDNKIGRKQGKLHFNIKFTEIIPEDHEYHEIKCSMSQIRALNAFKDYFKNQGIYLL